MKKVLYYIPSIMLIAPAIASAQGEGLFRFFNMVMAAIQLLIPIIIGIAVIVFLVGVMQYIVAKDSDKQKEARSVMLYGVIALFVMVSVWGLVNILGDTLDLNVATPNPPGIPGVN